jgi:hypothetical protein
MHEWGGRNAGDAMLSSLDAFQRLARSGRLGQPVFFRCQITGPPERALETLAETLADATALLEDVPRTLQTRGEIASGCLHAILVFRSGSSVLVATGPGEETVDAMLLGNHGAAYQGSGVQAFRRSGVQDAASSEPERLNARTPERRSWFLTAIRQSLAAGQPLQLEGWADG